MEEVNRTTLGTYILAGMYRGNNVHLWISQKESLNDIEENIRKAFPSHRFAEIHIFDLKPSSAPEFILPGNKLRQVGIVKAIDPIDVQTTLLVNEISRMEDDEELDHVLDLVIHRILEIKKRRSQPTGI